MYLKIIYLELSNDDTQKRTGLIETFDILCYRVDYSERSILFKLAGQVDAQAIGRERRFTNIAAIIYIMNNEGQTIDTYRFLTSKEDAKNEHAKENDTIPIDKEPSSEASKLPSVQNSEQIVFYVTNDKTVPLVTVSNQFQYASFDIRQKCLERMLEWIDTQLECDDYDLDHVFKELEHIAEKTYTKISEPPKEIFEERNLCKKVDLHEGPDGAHTLFTVGTVCNKTIFAFYNERFDELNADECHAVIYRIKQLLNDIQESFDD